MIKTALIIGVTGQDGAYLSELLISKGYMVYGTHRLRSNNFSRLKSLGLYRHERLKLMDLELSSSDDCIAAISNIQPDEVYNLASHSFVGDSVSNPVGTIATSGMSTVYLLDAIRQYSHHSKFFQACSSEMFGNVDNDIQDENSRFNPRNPYGVAKLLSYYTAINYRDVYDVFACVGILYNHESPLRGLDFLTSKVTSSAVKIKLGIQERLEIGNMESYRDWGYAKEYVEAMYLMMQQDRSDTFILSTGILTSVREFIRISFEAVGIALEFRGEGVNEYAIDTATGNVVVEVNPKFYRPTEQHTLLGNPKKAEKLLGWRAKTDVRELAEMMVNNYIKEYQEL
ncbi:GDP-mannose 4,6-dehydratase [Francisella philomiragia]|uniref:GDP-mannose 4,6-dehydratase n=1 Tax=Francisella philomiragia TaxID=28110 RepID=UPI001F27AE4D|nr:GDP-mannose 4,6-dehydratase [Francisella philomiragia]MBK2297095.1 GDP-mannose 4,6-dehydratase [Francisella philomiragia]MBK2341341.1 GDP-mannose 4,6-dehydratase [Francisella philomiragia]